MSKKSGKINLSPLFWIMLIVMLLVAIYLSRYVTHRYSSAQSVITASLACQTDQFLCHALSLINERDFVDALYSGTITTFDGSNTVVKSWKSDTQDGFSMTTTIDGKETDTLIRKQDADYYKDQNNNNWKMKKRTQPDTNLSAQKYVVEQMGIDEDLGWFFVGDPRLANYTFQNLGTQTCGTNTCVEYLALNKLTTDAAHKEYLYFDQTTFKLVKYQLEVSSGYRREETFQYRIEPTIEPPSATPVVEL